LVSTYYALQPINGHFLRKLPDSASVGNLKKDSVITQSKIPFDGYDLSWINGQNRQTDFPLTLKDKNGETILTGVAYVDSYFNYDFNRPKDNTHNASQQ
jgi:hypothetical protein